MSHPPAVKVLALREGPTRDIYSQAHVIVAESTSWRAVGRGPACLAVRVEVASAPRRGSLPSVPACFSQVPSAGGTLYLCCVKGTSHISYAKESLPARQKSQPHVA